MKMENQKKYTVNLTVTSSSFPNHPKLAVLVAKRMWQMNHPLTSISSLSGIPMETIQQVSKVEGWVRMHSRLWVTNYHGPFLMSDEYDELLGGQRYEDDPVAVNEREADYKPRYYGSGSVSSALGWL